MKSTKNMHHIQRAVRKLLKQYPVIATVAHDIEQENGRVYVVGGAVRDLLLKLPVKDVDIEVHGIPLTRLQSILAHYGPVRLVGKQFGVLRIDGIDIDWALPRTDSSGRKPRVVINPNMAIKDAFARRDLTINAMGIDLGTYELVDPFGGLKDLKAKKLRAPHAAFFKEDPLRLFRVMQFISRFDMQPDAQLNRICKTMNIASVSRERIEQECNKMFLKSKNPSRGLRWLKKIGRLKEIFPELAATIGIKQDPSWHPEGDVFEHTMQAVDAVARLPIKDAHERLVLFYAALCHDLGKVSTTAKRKDGHITSYGHDEAGAILAKKLLKRITNNTDLMRAVEKLVRHHMAPIQFHDNKAKAPAYKRLANKLAPECTLQMVAYLSCADRQGRNPKKNVPLRKKEWPAITYFRKQAEKCNIFTNSEEPILHGRDLMDVVPAGPQMGKLIKLAYEIQLDEGIKDKDELKRRVLETL